MAKKCRERMCVRDFILEIFLFQDMYIMLGQLKSTSIRWSVNHKNTNSWYMTRKISDIFQLSKSNVIYINLATLADLMSFVRTE